MLPILQAGYVAILYAVVAVGIVLARHDALDS